MLAAQQNRETLGGSDPRGRRDVTGKRFGEGLAALGVIASLLFVAIEVRQNTNAVRGATLQAVSQQSLDLTMAGLDNPELRSAFVVARDSSQRLSSEQRSLLRWFFGSKLRADENRLRQVELGILDPSTFGQLSSNMAYRLPYFREWWTENGGDYATDFQELVNREFLPLSQPPSEERP